MGDRLPALRAHRLLAAAGYDVYGNAGHQLNSRLYMDFLRMEGGVHFLVFLPQGARADARLLVPGRQLRERLRRV